MASSAWKERARTISRYFWAMGSVRWMNQFPPAPGIDSCTSTSDFSPTTRVSIRRVNLAFNGLIGNRNFLGAWFMNFYKQRVAIRHPNPLGG